MFFWPSFWPRLWLTGQVGRPGGRPNHGPVDRCGRPCARLADTGPIDRPVDRTREPALCIWAVDRAVDRISTTVIFLTVGGRPARSTVGLSGWQISLTASFWFGLYKPHFSRFWPRFSELIFPYSLVLKRSFQKSLKSKKIHLVCF